MTFINTSFETGDATPAPPSGLGSVATGWGVTYVSLGTAYANFGDTTITEAAERFERNWSTNESFLFAFALSSLSVATFSSGGPYASAVENFETLWSSNESFSFGLGRLELLNFSSTLLPAETFEVEWSVNENYKFSFDDTDLLAAPSGVETFETDWRQNQNFRTSFSPSALLAAVFDGTSPQFVEDFEQIDPHLWVVYLPLAVPDGQYKITVSGREVVFVAASSTTAYAQSSLITQINNLGEYYVASPADSHSFYLAIDERITSDPTLDLAQLLDGGSAIQVEGPSSPGVPLVALQRVDATTLWTQAGKLFSL